MCLDTIEPIRVRNNYGWKVFKEYPIIGKKNTSYFQGLFYPIAKMVKNKLYKAPKSDTLISTDYFGHMYVPGFHVFLRKQDAKEVCVDEIESRSYDKGNGYKISLQKVMFNKKDIIVTGTQDGYPVVVVKSIKIV
jgi:hypothetical protein